MQSAHYDSRTLDRFMSKVEKTDYCWNWTGKGSNNGNPAFSIGTTFYRAARVSYEIYKGDVPDEMQVTKSCGNALCVNPDHLILKVDPKSKTAEQRFEEKIDKTDSCWNWTGKSHEHNGGLFYLDGRWVAAHHYAFKLYCSKEPVEGIIHRNCKNPLCVNPEHLYVATDPRGRSTEERFWEKVDKSGDCWNWTGKKVKRETHAYGRFWDGSRFAQAHRVAYELSNDCQIPKGLVICHKCDNPICCKPEHLFLGTQADNVADMISKGRGNHCHGDRVNTAKLTVEQVREIRKRYRPRQASALAREYGVSVPNIFSIVRRETWKHVN